MDPKIADALIGLLQFPERPERVFIHGDEMEDRSIDRLRWTYFKLIAEWTQADERKWTDEKSVMDLIDAHAKKTPLATLQKAAEAWEKNLDELVPPEERQKLVQILKTEVHNFFVRRKQAQRWNEATSQPPRTPPLP